MFVGCYCRLVGLEELFWLVSVEILQQRLIFNFEFSSPIQPTKLMEKNQPEKNCVTIGYVPILGAQINISNFIRTANTLCLLSTPPPHNCWSAI